MPNWNQVLDEIKAVGNAGSAFDQVRRKYLKLLHQKTGRNVIAYYSGWLQKGQLEQQGVTALGINDDDKNGFMATVHGLDRKLGLDLVLHTPGGEMGATESIVDYLRQLFDTDIRAIVPQIAMSAGTMIACASKQILMGKQSSLGPIDPQIGGLPTHGIVEEFDKAAAQIKENPEFIPLWQAIIANYRPTLIGECHKIIEWSDQIVIEWLTTGMFKDSPKASQLANRVMSEIGSHESTKSHSRHISLQKAQDIGLKVVPLEKDQELQDIVLTAHHACIQTLAATPVLKLVENHNGAAYMTQLMVVKT